MRVVGLKREGLRGVQKQEEWRGRSMGGGYTCLVMLFIKREYRGLEAPGERSVLLNASCM